MFFFHALLLLAIASRAATEHVTATPNFPFEAPPKAQVEDDTDIFVDGCDAYVEFVNNELKIEETNGQKHYKMLSSFDLVVGSALCFNGHHEKKKADGTKLDLSSQPFKIKLLTVKHMYQVTAVSEKRAVDIEVEKEENERFGRRIDLVGLLYQKVHGNAAAVVYRTTTTEIPPTVDGGAAIDVKRLFYTKFKSRNPGHYARILRVGSVVHKATFEVTTVQDGSYLTRQVTVDLDDVGAALFEGCSIHVNLERFNDLAGGKKLIWSSQDSSLRIAAGNTAEPQEYHFDKPFGLVHHSLLQQWGLQLYLTQIGGRHYYNVYPHRSVLTGLPRLDDHFASVNYNQDAGIVEGDAFVGLVLNIHMSSNVVVDEVVLRLAVVASFGCTFASTALIHCNMEDVDTSGSISFYLFDDSFEADTGLSRVLVVKRQYVATGTIVYFDVPAASTSKVFHVCSIYGLCVRVDGVSLPQEDGGATGPAAAGSLRDERKWSFGAYEVLYFIIAPLGLLLLIWWFGLMVNYTCLRLQ